MLTTFLTEVMLITGLGALLDNVFIDTKERQKISAYLEDRTGDLSLNQRFSRFLERAHSIIFGRFFGARLFSLGFLASAATISLVSFSIVLGAQIYFFPEQFVQLRLDGVQILLFAAFILFNIVFDYLTIIQTKIFVEASLSAKSIFRAVIFIGSDLVVTMNTFILSYALFVLVVVQTFVAEPKAATILLSDARPAQESSPTNDRGFLAEFADADFSDKIKYQGKINGALFPNHDSSAVEEIVVYFYSSFDPQSAEQQANILATLSALNVSNVRLSEIVDQQKREEYISIYFGTLWNLERQLDGEVEDRRIYSLSFNVDGSKKNYGSIMSAYTVTFNLIDILEDAFPVSLTGSMELLSLSSLIRGAVTAPKPNLPTAICFENGNQVSRVRVADENVEFLNSCADFITFEPLWSLSFDRDLALVGREMAGYRVPFNTLFITSVLPTAFFYLTISLLAIAVVCFSKAIKGTNRVKRFFLRAPLAISGFFFGVVLSLTGLI